MKEIPIAASLREDSGKGSARQLRRGGQIPAVLYGPEIEPLNITIEERDLRTAMKAAGSSAIYDLTVDGRKNKVIVREIQRDPITSRVIHIDLLAISMVKPISISVPIDFVGTPRGVKTDGGIMQVTMRELDVSCLPTDIPDTIEVDVADLGIGDSVHVRDLTLDKVKILSEARRTMVVISAPTVVKAAAEAEEVAEGEEVPAEGEEAPAEGEEAPKEEKGKEEKTEEKK
jgi:large subunit ribosomal protein L25